MSFVRGVALLSGWAAVRSPLSIFSNPWILPISAMVWSAYYGFLIGQDINFDLHNYHFYSGYALWNNVSDQHIMPAQVQTFLNPLLSLPAYLLIANLPPWGVGVILGLVQGVNIVLIYILSRQVLATSTFASLSTTGKHLVALVATLIGATAPLFLSEIGTTFGDNVTSLLVLTALIMLLRYFKSARIGFIVIAGLAVGVAVALKLTNVVFLVGLVVSGWWISANWRASAYRLGVFGVGVAVAVVAFYGFWSWHLWREFESPLFPFYNEIFKSPYFDAVGIADLRFIPESLTDALTYPIQWALGQHPSAELAFQDLRFLFIAVLALLVLPEVLLSLRSMQTNQGAHARLSLLIFFFSSFLLWMALFSIHRYIIALELLSGIVIYLLLDRLIGADKSKLWAFVLVAVLVVAWTRPPDWGHLAWDKTWFQVEVPLSLQRHDQMFVMLDTEPLSYVIPFFPQDSRFVRVGGNIIPSPQTGLAQMLQEAVSTQNGPIFSFSASEPSSRQARLLARYGLEPADEECIRFKSRVNPSLVSCPLMRR